MARPLPPAVRAGLAAAGALVVVVVLLVGYVKVKAALTPPPPPPPYTGVAKVAFSQPTGARPLSGNQVIKLSVAAPQHLSYVELSVDGKHWERFTRPPFQTEWPTPIVKNGRHVLEAKAVYRGGKRVALARRVCVTRNRFTAR